MELLERAEELAALSSQWERALGGAGSLVLVTGESGIGKTTLVQGFLDGIGEDAAPAWGGCDPLTTPRPLGPLHDVAEDLGDHVAAVLRGGYPHEIFEAVVEALKERTRVVVLEDLHWADEGTVDLLRFLLRRIDRVRSLIIGTLRLDELAASHPLRQLLGDVARSSDAHQLTLRPLSVDAVAALIGVRPIDPMWVHDLTGGNSFFVREVLDHGGDELPVTVRDAVLARTVELDVEARLLLDLLACAPEGIPDRLLPCLGVGIAPLRALAEAGLIHRGDRGVAVRHELCRLALAADLPPGGEVTLHMRILDALETVPGADPAVLAHHAVAAGDQERIIKHASLAGLAAARAGAHRQAAEFFETALRRGAPTSADEEAELLELLAGELYLTDRLDDAIDACGRAMSLRERAGDPAGVSANHQAMSMFQWYNANRAVAERHASEAVAAVAAGEDLLQLGHAQAMEAYLALQSSRIDLAQAFLARGHEIAAEVEDHQLSVRLELLDLLTSVAAGDTTARSRVLDILEGAAEHFDEMYSSGYSNVAYLDVEHRRFREAAAVLEVSLPLTVERDIPICHVWQLGARGRLALLEGDWDAAVSDANEVLSAPSAPLARTWPLLVRGLVGLRRGDDGADADLDEAWTVARRFGEPLRLLPAAAAQVERAWLRGSRLADVEEVRDLLGLEADGISWSVGDLAVWLCRCGLTASTDLVGLAEPHRLALSGAPAAAAEVWATLSSPYEQALSLLDTGDIEEARTALDLLDRLGADAVAAKVRRELRESGVSNVPSRRRAATRANPAGLTARQVEVVRLLADGLTNAELAERLYISPKTADHHVSAVLAKLQVGTRREAARAAREMGLLGGGSQI